MNVHRIAFRALMLLFLAGSFLGAAGPDLSVAPAERSQTFQVRGARAEFTLETSGLTPVVNREVEITGPAQNVVLTVAGGLDFSSVEALSKSLIRPGMTDEEKVKAVFYFAVNNLYDRGSTGCDDPHEYISIYGHSYCGNFALLLNAMWRSLGYETVFLNPVIGQPSGHTITAVKYDNRWHMYDSRLRGYFLNADNHTVASLVELDRDDSLLRRGLDYQRRMMNHWNYFTILTNYHNAESDWYDGYNANFDNNSLFNTACPVWDPRLDLRKGEKAILRWDNEGRWWNRKDFSERWKQLHRNEGREAMTVPPLLFGNGRLEFEIDPTLYAAQAHEHTGIRAAGGRSPAFQPSADGGSGYVVYRVRAPYFIPSMRVEAGAILAGSGDAVKVLISGDGGMNWVTLGEASGAGSHRLSFESDETQRSTMYSVDKYSYLVKFALQAAGKAAGARLENVRLSSDLFYREMILPALHDGVNRIAWRDEARGAGTRSVTWRWTEDLNILFSEDRPCEDDSLTVTALVGNNGGQPALNVTVRFYDGDPAGKGRPIGETVIPEVAPGVVERAEIRWQAVQYDPEASHGISIANQTKVTGYRWNTIHVAVDPERSIEESDRSNNTTSRRLIVYNKADLVLVDPSFITFERNGDRVRLSAMVRNHNLYGWLPRAREARDVAVRFYDGQPQAGRLDDKLIGEAVIPSIPPGEFGTARVEWDVSDLSGLHRVYVVVDPFDRIPEKWQVQRRQYIQLKKDIDLSE